MAMFALPLVGNQRGVLQHFQVPGNGGQRNLERFGQLAHRRVAERQPGQDRAAGGIGQGRERGVELHHLTGMLINVLVKSSTNFDPDLFLTKEHTMNILAGKKEIAMRDWLKDMAGGVILLVFVGSSFGLADMAQAVLTRA